MFKKKVILGQGKSGGHMSEVHQETKAQIPWWWTVWDSPHILKWTRLQCPTPIHVTKANNTTTASATTYSTHWQAFLLLQEALPVSPKLWVAKLKAWRTHWSLGQFKARAVREASVRLPQPDRQRACSRWQPLQICTTPSSVMRWGEPKQKGKSEGTGNGEMGAADKWSLLLVN